MTRRRSLLLLPAWVALAVPLGAQTAGLAPRETRPARRVLRRWQDVIKVDGVDVSRRVELAFDYQEGVARETAYDAAGRVLSTRVLEHQLPQPSREEIADAVAVMRSDALIGRIMSRTGAVPTGGFILREPAGHPCAERTRCLQILLLSPDQHGLIRRVVVDLTKGAVAYRAYVPEENEAAK